MVMVGGATCLRWAPRSLYLEVLRRGLSTVGYEFVLDLLALVERAQAGPLDGRHMDEDVLSALGRLDEAVAFGRIEPLDSSASHYRSPGSQRRKIATVPCQAHGRNRNSGSRGARQFQVAGAACRTSRSHESVFAGSRVRRPGSTLCLQGVLVQTL